MATVQVRYIVGDVGEAIAFYTELLGFRLLMHPAAAFAMLARGDFRLVLSAPNPSPGGGQRTGGGEGPAPGGWNRFAIQVDDLAATVERLQAAGARFRNDIVTGIGVKQIILEDPSGNPVELFEPVLDQAALVPAADEGIPTEIRQLLAHMEWADAAIWRAVLALDGAAGDPRVREILHHAHTVQWVYLQLWRHEDVAVEELEAFPGLPALSRWGRDYYRQLPGFLAEVDAEALDRRVHFPWADALAERYGEVRPADLRQSMLQVASHSTYHRGQVNARLRELAGEPPLTDFVAWVWAGQPGPKWPELR